MKRTVVLGLAVIGLVVTVAAIRYVKDQLPEFPDFFQVGNAGAMIHAVYGHQSDSR